MIQLSETQLKAMQERIAAHSGVSMRRNVLGETIPVIAPKKKPVGKPPSIPESAFAAQLKFLKLPEPKTEFRFDRTRKWRFDFAWPEKMLAVEIEGGTWAKGRHTSGTGYEKDCEKYNSAVYQGWRVLRFTTAMVKDGRAITVAKECLL